MEQDLLLPLYLRDFIPENAKLLKTLKIIFLKVDYFDRYLVLQNWFVQENSELDHKSQREVFKDHWEQNA